MKLLSRQAHGVLDYLTVVGLLGLPALTDWPSDVRQLLRGAALATLSYSLITRYEMGLVPLLPFRYHLALDIGGGGTCCAAALLRRYAPASARAALLSIGLIYIAVPMITELPPDA